MTANLKGMLAAFAILGAAATATPASAGGDYGTKDYAGVPVPAPIPVPLYDPVWYFRVDLTLGLSDDLSASEKGMVLGRGDSRYRSSDPFGTEPSWLDSHYEGNFSYGFGIGYKWNNWLRTDVTAETKRSQKVRVAGEGTTGLDQYLQGGGWWTAPGSYHAEVEDEAKLRGGLVMFNAYYDFNKWGAFRPYVGAGLGIGITEIARQNFLHERAIDPSTGSDVTHETYDGDSHVRHTETSLAASVTVGTSYVISDITELDFNYRYLWVDGVDSNLVVNGAESTISVDSMSEHNLRAGLRFNVN